MIKRVRTDEETWRRLKIYAAENGITLQKAVKELTNNSSMWKGVEKVEKQTKRFRFPY